jgi:MinD-like ATPase involved in chromosome partitioning or flagellar assembly
MTIHEPLTPGTQTTEQRNAVPETAPMFAGARRASSYIEHAEPPHDYISLAVEVPSEVAALSDVGSTAEVVEAAPVETDLGVIAITAGQVIARRGIRGALAKIGIRLEPGAAETEELNVAALRRRHEDTIRQATWTRAVSILVANPKGGVGKTPTALLVGGMLAAIRGGSVCVLEISDDPGALTFRSEGSPPRGLGELVRDAATIRSAGQLAGYTAPQTSFASVIGSTGSRSRLEGEDVIAVTDVIDDYFAIRVMDSGNQPSSTAFQAALETTDALLIPIANAGDAALEAAALLDGLRAIGGKAAQLAANAIVVRLHDGRPENPQVIARVEVILASYGIQHIHEIPFDPHIAERGQLTLTKLTEDTRHALTATAADVIHTLQVTVR